MKAKNIVNDQSEIYDKLIIRTVYGIVNAGRNLV
jgi:hypothetical protein